MGRRLQSGHVPAQDWRSQGWRHDRITETFGNDVNSSERQNYWRKDLEEIEKCTPKTDQGSQCRVRRPVFAPPKLLCRTKECTERRL